MNEESYQQEMDEQAQFEAEQNDLKNKVYEKLSDCYAIVREKITDELTSDVSPTDWSKISDIGQAMQDLTYYLDIEEWDNALVEINNFL